MISKFRIEIVFLTLCCGLLFHPSVIQVASLTSNVGSKNLNIECPEEDSLCPKDKMGFEAITSLHAAIDDDRDGNLDRSESDEFIRDELKYEDGFERHTSFHGADDDISVKDLWKIWTESDVYNWTTEEVIEWLVSHVELPQYTETFRVNEVEGRTLPRLAVSGHFGTSILGMKNAIDKQKLAVKAQDVVLFGPPKKPHSYVKDALLVLSLVIATAGCWLAYMQHKYSQSHLKKVMKDLDSLQKAEDALTELQTKLDEAHKEKDSYKEEKQSLESKMKDEIDYVKQEAEELRVVREATAEEIGRLKLAEQELEKYKRALEKAEIELQKRHHAPLGELQQWLQLTYEMESRHYDAKREAAEKQLLMAKEMYNKLKRKKSQVFGSLQLAHGHADLTDKAIAGARSALEEVKSDLQERSSRWQQIEKICGFCVVSNPGMDFLDSLLRAPSGSVSSNNLRDLVQPQLTVDDADDAEVPPGAFAAQAVFYGLSAGKNGRAIPCKPNSPYSNDYHLHSSPFYNHKPPSLEKSPTLFSRAIHPFPPGSEQHQGLSSAYGGSYDPLVGATSLFGGQAGVRQAMPRAQAVRSVGVVPSANGVPATKQTSLTESTDSEDLDSRVSFDLGENSSSSNIPRNGAIPTTTTTAMTTSLTNITHSAEDVTMENAPKLSQSKSMETKAVIRPRVFPHSLSEGTLSGLSGLKQANPAGSGSHGNVQKPTSHKPTILESPEEEENRDGMSSLSNSLDSLDSNGKEKSGKKKTRFLNKIFKGSKLKES